MRKKRKQLLGIALAASVLFSGGRVSAAIPNTAENGAITVSSVNTEGGRAHLDISEKGDATAMVCVTGKNGTTKLTVKMRLQKYDRRTKDWSDVKVWEKTVESRRILIEKSHSLTTHGSYRCYATIYAWRNGIKEITTCASDRQQY